MPWDNGGRDGNVAVAGHVTPRIAGNQQKLERNK